MVHRFLVPLVVGSSPTASAKDSLCSSHSGYPPLLDLCVKFVALVVGNRYSRIFISLFMWGVLWQEIH